MKIIVQHDDGTEIDVTEGVQVAYDTAYGSMDWGSGFLDLEEMEAVARLAEACRFPSFPDALESVQRAREDQEKTLAYQEEQRRKQAAQEALMRQRPGTPQYERLMAEMEKLP